MKKILSMIMVCILVLSGTACSLQRGDPAHQEAKLMEFVTKHYGEAEVLEKSTEMLDSASVYRLKDKQDGFEYPMTALEVYMSDLGFVSSDDTDNQNQKTLVFDGQFTMKYVSNLVQKKIPREEFEQVCQNFPKLMDVSIFTYDETVNDVFTVETEETAMMMQEMDESAIRAMATLMKKYDDRNVLQNYIMPIYLAEQSNGMINIKYENDEAMLLGYYDFFFDYIIQPEHFDGVGTLHDYLVNSDYEKITIKAVNHDVPQSAVEVEEGFSFLPAVNAKGTFIILDIDGTSYEFFTLPGVRDFTTETDEYGIHKGSFLDIMATERSGGRDVMIAYYAALYPYNFTDMSMHLKPVSVTSDATTEQNKTTETEENAG